MSMALKQSKANAGFPQGGAFIGRSEFMGDPGLFGFIGKAISKVGGLAASALPGPVGTLARTFFPTRPSSPTILRTPPFAAPVSVFPRNIQEFPNGGGTPAGAPVQTGTGARQRFFPTGATGLGEGCQAGFHPNKTAYFLKDGSFVDVGTRCVKNRRRNPLNPRAASRAISRLESAKKATRSINRITIRCDRCHKGFKCAKHR